MAGFCVAQLKSENQVIHFEELQQKMMAEKKHLLHCYPYIYIYIHICQYFCLPISFSGSNFSPTPKKNSVVEMRCFCFSPGTGEQYSRRDATVGSTFGGRDFCHQRCRW